MGINLKKFILVAALAFCPLFGQSQATTGFHRVETALARAQSGVTAQIVPGAKVTVTQTSTGTAATIYSDPLLTNVITPSVVTADTSGNYSYYIALNYCVTETITSPGQGTRTIPNICINGGGGGGGCPDLTRADYAQFSNDAGTACKGEVIDLGVTLADTMTIAPNNAETPLHSLQIISAHGGFLIDPTGGGTGGGSTTIYGRDEDAGINLNAENGEMNLLSSQEIRVCGYNGYGANHCPNGQLGSFTSYGTIGSNGGDNIASGAQFYTDFGSLNDQGFVQYNPLELAFGGSPHALNYAAHFTPCDASGGNVVLNLDQITSSPNNNGVEYRFVKEDSSGNTCTINAFSGQTIDGNASVVLSTQYQSADLIANLNVSSGDGAFWSEINSGSGSSLALQHNSTPLPLQSLLNFLDTPDSLTPPALDSGYQPVVFKNDTHGGLGAETAGFNPSGSLQMQAVPPVSGQYVVLPANSVSPEGTNVIPCTSFTALITYAASASPYSASVERLESGGIACGGTTATLTWTGATLLAGISPSSVTRVDMGWVYSFSCTNNLCGVPSGTVNGGTAYIGANPYNAPLGTYTTNVCSSSCGTFDFAAAQWYYQNTDSGTWLTPPWGSIATLTPVMFVYYTGSPVTSPTLVNVQPPLLFNNNNLSIQLPDNAGIDNHSSTSPNAYAIDLPGYSVTPPAAVLGLLPGTNVCFDPATTNTSTAPTFSISTSADGFPIALKDGSALQLGDIVDGKEVCVVLDQNGYWQIINPQLSGSGGSVFGQANGVIPLATAATIIGAQSHLSDNGTDILSSLPIIEGTLGTYTVTIGNQSTMTGSWNFDTTSPTTALDSILTLTTTGSGGAATLTGTTLNIPNYAGGGGLGTFEDEVITMSGTSGSFSHSPSTLIGLFKNGQRLTKLGGSPDFSSSGTSITLTVAAISGDFYEAIYWY